jgi:hypothetical protein
MGWLGSDDGHPARTDEWYRLIGRFTVAFEHANRAATLFVDF